MRNNQIATDSILESRLVTAGGTTMRPEEAILVPGETGGQGQKILRPHSLVSVQVLLDALRGLYPCFRKTRSATFSVDLMVGGYLHRESLFHLYDHCSTAGHSKSLCPAESLQLEIVIAGEKVQTAVCRSQGFESRSIFPLQ